MIKKLSLGELIKIEEKKHDEKSARKIYSLTTKDNFMLKKLFSKRLNLKNETSISQIMSEAIELLYNQEFSKE